MQTAELRVNQSQDPFGLNQAALFNSVEAVFAPKDFSAVKEAAVGGIALDFARPMVDVGDFHVTAPTVAEAEQMRLKASVEGVGVIAVADYGVIAQAEAIVRNSFLELSPDDEDDESDSEHGSRHSSKKVFATV